MPGAAQLREPTGMKEFLAARGGRSLGIAGVHILTKQMQHNPFTTEGRLMVHARGRPHLDQASFPHSEVCSSFGGSQRTTHSCPICYPLIMGPRRLASSRFYNESRGICIHIFLASSVYHEYRPSFVICFTTRKYKSNKIINLTLKLLKSHFARL